MEVPLKRGGGQAARERQHWLFTPRAAPAQLLGWLTGDSHGFNQLISMPGRGRHSGFQEPRREFIGEWAGLE